MLALIYQRHGSVMGYASINGQDGPHGARGEGLHGTVGAALAPLLAMRRMMAMMAIDTLQETNIWVWVNTYRYIFSGMKCIYQLFWGSLGTRVLTHPDMVATSCDGKHPH